MIEGFCALTGCHSIKVFLHSNTTEFSLILVFAAAWPLPTHNPEQQKVYIICKRILLTNEVSLNFGFVMMGFFFNYESSCIMLY